MPENINIEVVKFLAAVAGATGAAIAAIVAGIISLIGNLINRRSEERRHLLDLCSRMAAENLTRDIENARVTAANTGHSVPLAPIDTYFIHMLSLANAIRSRGSQQEMIVEWKRISGITESTIKQAITEDAERRKQKTQSHD